MKPEIVDFVKRFKTGNRAPSSPMNPDEEKRNPDILKPSSDETKRKGGVDFSADVPVLDPQIKKGGGVDVLGALEGALAGFAGGPESVLGLARQRQSVVDSEADRIMKAKEFSAKQHDAAMEAEKDRQNKREIADAAVKAAAEARSMAREDRQALLDAARAERETTKKEKQTQDDLELNVPGWGRSADIRPTSEEAKKAREGLANFSSFEKGINNLKDLIKKYGSTNMAGQGSSDAGSLATGLKLTLKNIAQLGVMSESDAELLAQQIVNPNELASLKISTPGAIEQLDSTLRQAREKMEAGMSSKGYKRAAGVATPPPSLGENGSKIKVSNGTESLWIDPADEADAAKDGYKRV